MSSQNRARVIKGTKLSITSHVSPQIFIQDSRVILQTEQDIF